MIPGEIMPGEGPVTLNAGREAITLIVANTGDRPVQVGSHFHFAQANAALRFDRDLAWGHRLNVPAGTAVRFEPGVEREVSLVPLTGRRVVPGLQIGGPRLRETHSLPETRGLPETPGLPETRGLAGTGEPSGTDELPAAEESQ